MSDINNGGPRRLTRSRKGQVVAGVCSGVGQYLNIDANLVRLGFVILAVFGGMGILLYLAAWVILPEEGEDNSIAETWVNKRRS